MKMPGHGWKIFECTGRAGQEIALEPLSFVGKCLLLALDEQD